MKVKNITPEERENALALIRKCGVEETENNINYYVRMQRDSKKNRGEKDELTENNSSSCTGKILGLGIIIALFLMIKMCGGCEGCSGCSGGNSDTSDIETITWKCEKCGYEGTYYYNKKEKYSTGEFSKVAYGKRVCASCYADYERWKPAVDAARKKFGGL